MPKAGCSTHSALACPNRIFYNIQKKKCYFELLNMYRMMENGKTVLYLNFVFKRNERKWKNPALKNTYFNLHRNLLYLAGK